MCVVYITIYVRVYVYPICIQYISVYIYIYILVYIYLYMLSIYIYIYSQSFQPFPELFSATERFIEKLSSLGNLFECSQVALIVWIVFSVAGSIRIVCRIDGSHVPDTTDADTRQTDSSVTSRVFSLVWVCFSMISISSQVFAFSFPV